MSYCIKLFLLILLSTNVYSQNKFPLAINYYNLELSFDYKEELMDGICELKIQNQSGETVNQIPLLLYRLLRVESVRNEANVILPFTQNVTQFEDFQKLQTNYILIDEKVLPHETKNIKIHYSGHLLGYQETGMKYINDRISPEFTMIRNDAYSYPIIGKPSFAFVRKNITAHQFEYKINVTVPDSLVVTNGGVLESVTTENSESTYQYISKKPNWRIDIAIAPYKKMQNERLEIYYFKDDSLQAYNMAEYGIKAMTLYRNWWGELKNENTITIIETEEKSGGQTDETTILLPREAFTDIDYYDYIYHELSHLWNVKIEEKEGLSPRWEEGLATFSQYLIAEKLIEEKVGLTKRNGNSFLKRLKSYYQKNPKLLKTPMSEFGNEQLTDYSYSQPMLMFCVLYYWLGEEKFNQGIGGFYQNYYNTGASTKDFTNYWIKTNPNKELDSFFSDWVYGPKYTSFILKDMSIDQIINHYKK